MSASKFIIQTLGCKINQYESGKLEAFLLAKGLQTVLKGADLVILNTCAVTKTAIAKDKYILNKLKRENPGAKTVVMGCWPKAYQETAATRQADLFWGVRNHRRLIAKIQALWPNLFPVDHGVCLHKTIISKSSDRSRYFIKIQDGCNQFCSYCVIPYTRGRLKTRSEREVLAEIKRAVKSGFEEVVLSGIHLGLYGRELKNPVVNQSRTLSELLAKIILLPGLGRVRLSSIEINDVSDELIKLMKSSPKICRHLHISLQSGSDKILKLMNRPYDTDYFRRRLEKLRSAMQNIAISTDVIVGFPGETKNDFEDTWSFCDEMNFSKIHVFSFSPHEKTPAFNMPGRVSREDISARSSRLRQLSILKEKSYRQNLLDEYKESGLLVAVEHYNEQSKLYKGKTEFYFDVFFKAEQLLSRGVVDGGDLVGKIVQIKA